MNEYLVVLTTGTAYVFADRYTKDGDTYYFIKNEKSVMTYPVDQVVYVLENPEQ